MIMLINVKRKWIIGFILLNLLLIAYNSIPIAAAADRALLVGIGQFQSPAITRLPGIGTDIQIMRRNARLLGFTDANIKILEDQQATLAAVESAFKSWLIDGVGPQDRVLFYFSGHGSNVQDLNGDEADSVDEALLLYDTAFVPHHGEVQPVNVLLDDHLGALLRSIPSRNVLVLLDACHSGTATRTFGDLTAPRKVTKQYRYQGMPRSRVNGFMEVRDDANFVAISAAGDNESAIATPRGSLFTLGLQAVIQDAARKRWSLSPEIIRDLVSRFIEANTLSKQRF